MAWALQVGSCCFPHGSCSSRASIAWRAPAWLAGASLLSGLQQRDCWLCLLSAHEQSPILEYGQGTASTSLYQPDAATGCRVLLCRPAAHATPGRDSAWNSSGMLPAHTPAEPDEYRGEGHLPTPLSNSAGAQPTPTPQSHGATPFRASAVAGGVLGPYAQVRDECASRPMAPLQAALLQAVVVC